MYVPRVKYKYVYIRTESYGLSFINVENVVAHPLGGATSQVNVKVFPHCNDTVECRHSLLTRVMVTPTVVHRSIDL